VSTLRPVILVVEDEAAIRRFLRTSLEAQGLEIEEAPTGREALTLAGNRRADVMILDLGLPDMDGVKVIRALRAWSAMPVIVLSARSQETDKIAALDAGADDYVVKPFATGELVARVKAALRRAARPDEGQGPLRAGELVIDLEARRVLREGMEVKLTPTEYRLLAALARHPGRVLTQRTLLTEVWGPGYVERPHYLRIFMANLRRKLERDPARPRHLLTETGVGYRFAAS
jgi:two-component system, OmpR family, KDP operon response regulator KdpE